MLERAKATSADVKSKSFERLTSVFAVEFLFSAEAGDFINAIDLSKSLIPLLLSLPFSFSCFEDLLLI